MLDVDLYQRAKGIFFEACEQPRHERLEFVGRACAGDASLEQAVRDLLAHDSNPLTLIDRGGMRRHVEHLTGAIANPSALPARIGRYRLLRLLGEGGMGVVYLAEQENPRRQVALKVIAAAQATPAALRRFEHEAQVLGLLQHPGIAQIHEAGTFDAGRGAQPFFAMEYVRGRTLLRYCDETGADRRTRLELFIRVCEAVQHAHHKGVVHRDLKPANILVEESAEQPDAVTEVEATSQTASSLPLIKILDFGVARLIGGDRAADTMHTAAGQLVGTLTYMSPEQLSGDPSQIDLRSDVYALGVILFELLAGRLPHDLTNMTVPESIRAVSEREPTHLAAVNRTYRGDLDTIVGKALERDKTRRYQSVGELAADVRRYLMDEPIHARPPSTIYQLRKFARRNKALVGGIAAVFVVLVGGIIGTSWQARQAIAARDQQKGLREKADASAARAQAEADKATAVNAFLCRMLASANPEVTQGREVLVGEVLDSAAAEINAGALGAQPDVEILVRMTIGETYLSIGRVASARQHFQKALDLSRSARGARSEEAAAALAALAEVLSVEGDLDTAAKTVIEALAIYRERFGDTDRMEVAQALDNFSEYRMTQARMAEAIDLRRQSLEMMRRLKGDDDEEVAQNAVRLASMLHDPDEAEPMIRHALDAMRERGGERQPSYIAGLRTLAGLLTMRGAYDEAEATSRQALALGVEVYGRDHQRNLLTLQNLCFSLRMANKPKEFALACNESIDMARRLYGNDSMRVAESLIERADVQRVLNDLPASEVDYREALAIAERNRLGHDVRACIARISIASAVLLRDGDLDEAQALAQSVVDVRDELRGEQQWLEGQALSLLGEVALRRGELDKAERLALEGFDRLGTRSLIANQRRLAAERVARVYDAREAASPNAGFADKAVQWRARATDLKP